MPVSAEGALGGSSIALSRAPGPRTPRVVRRDAFSHPPFRIFSPSAGRIYGLAPRVQESSRLESGARGGWAGRMTRLLPLCPRAGSQRPGKMKSGRRARCHAPRMWAWGRATGVLYRAHRALHIAIASREKGERATRSGKPLRHVKTQDPELSEAESQVRECKREREVVGGRHRDVAVVEGKSAKSIPLDSANSGFSVLRLLAHRASDRAKLAPCPRFSAGEPRARPVRKNERKGGPYLGARPSPPHASTTPIHVAPALARTVRLCPFRKASLGDPQRRMRTRRPGPRAAIYGALLYRVRAPLNAFALEIIDSSSEHSWRWRWCRAFHVCFMCVPWRPPRELDGWAIWATNARRYNVGQSIFTYACNPLDPGSKQDHDPWVGGRL
ncbi:hypothetical protein C8Q70DRAFT_532304 [Cubamyces menziesii]|nr:hypothetical protein C8Q70DRAFT_532304 [Cubamyces menziesii]